ncbi:unnamed protein product [Phyllotreta striolata]|uniref:Uncharacterized protein n=1 Tax=Phyllotreta striolata TaxID=444603 RepID=A0A9N9U1P9_PHYSR|nr:unnamed protein product [Phyllotreta striolata]
MKCLIILAFCAGVTFKFTQADLHSELQVMKTRQTECENSLGEPKNFMEKLVAKEDLGDMEKAKKMNLCLFIKMGLISETGEILQDKLKAHLKKLTNDENIRKRGMEQCGKNNGNNPTEVSWNFVNCMKNLFPEVFPIDFQTSPNNVVHDK